MAGTPGLVERHSKRCSSRQEGARCDCTPTWEAWVFDGRLNDGKGGKHRKTFAVKGAAKTWRQDMVVGVRRGEVAASRTVLTIDDIVCEWMKAARKGTARTRGRQQFAGSTIRVVEQNYRLRVEDRFARRRVDRITLMDLQEWVDELDAEDVHPGTIETSVLPLRLAYRRAKTQGLVSVDPTDGLELPQKPTRGASRRPPAAKEIHAVLDAVPEQDRAAWTVLCSGACGGGSCSAFGGATWTSTPE